MPIAGNTPIQPESRKAYFDSLYQLDAWITNPDQKPEGTLPYVPRNRTRDPHLESRGKLLVCHDFKGGYNESPFSLSYTFNFWSMNDIFVYFSHHLVTVPPPAWIHSAHRHGVKILGVLLFEHKAQGPDLHLLLSGTSAPLSSTSSSPFLYYADALADLASQRGFDGYLLNFELSMSNSAAQALVEWVRVLREELWKKVGSHAEVIWYDSVITAGKVSYQNKLNEHNLLYFLASTGFFSNYWWRQNYPHDTMEYFYTLDTDLLNTRAMSPSVQSGSLTHQDVFMGIDVFGRKTFGGGGFDTHLALEVISPDGLGLSVALFAPGWTWESRQDEAGRTWEKWWKEEVTFWTGNVLGSDLRRLIKSQGSHTNEYRPVGHYFKPKPPPDPRVLPFFSTFSPGSGRAWWVEGERVWDASTDKDRHWTIGWLDIDKQGSIGDLVWPVPTISWNVESGDKQPQETTPIMTVLLDFDEAWNGGSSLKFLLSEPLQKGQVRHKRSLWMPIQSLSLTPGQSYTATAVYKTNNVKVGVVPNIELNLRSSDSSCDSIKVEVVSENKSVALRRNWTGLKTAIRVTSNSTEPVTLALGFTLDIEGEALADQECFSFSLGQVNVYASDRDGQVNDKLDQAAFTSAHQDQDGTVKVPALKNLDGILTWEAPSSHTSPSILERYAYWNIYVHLLSSSDKSAGIEKSRDAIWIGTSGPDYCGEKCKLGHFVILGKNITSCISVDSGEGVLRFYIQGVTECGETIPWQNVIQTDVRFKIQGGMVAGIKRLAM